jgi:hypothetical protein
MPTDVKRALRLLQQLKRVRLQQQRAPYAAAYPEEELDRDATVAQLIHLEQAARQRESATPGRIVTFTAAIGAPRADGSAFAPINPHLRNVLALRVVGGTVHHPAAPTFRAGIDDTIPFVYAQQWPLRRLRLHAGSLSAGGCLSVQFDMSAEASDSGDSTTSVVHRSFANVVALGSTVLVGVRTLSIDVGGAACLVVNSPEVPAGEGTLLSTADKRIKGTVSCDGTTLVGSGTSFASQLQKGDSLYVVERNTGRTHGVVVSAAPVAGDERVAVDGTSFGASYAWLDMDAYRVDLVRSAADGVCFPLLDALDALEWGAVGSFARSPEVTLCQEKESATRSKFMRAFSSGLGKGIELTPASDTAPPTFSRRVSASLVMRQSTMSMAEALFVCEGGLNHYARILEGAAVESTDEYVHVGSYGSQSSIYLRPPHSAAVTEIVMTFSSCSRNAGGVFGFRTDTDLRIKRQQSVISRDVFLAKRIGSTVAVICDELSASVGNTSGSGSAWFEYGAHEPDHLAQPSSTMSLAKSAVGAELVFNPPLALLPGLTLRFRSGGVAISADQLPVAQVLKLQATISAYR